MGAEREIAQKRCFSLGKRHDNISLKVQILLSRNFVVMAQAPKNRGAVHEVSILSGTSLSLPTGGLHGCPGIWVPDVRGIFGNGPNIREGPSTITIMNCTSRWTSG